MALSDFFPGLRRGTPHTSQWQSFLNDLGRYGVNVDPSQSGGFNPRTIAGTGTPSLHASDRAYDVNWSANPEGSAYRGPQLSYDMYGESARQPSTAIHPDIARDLSNRHGLRWGGDFRGRSPDPMHFEIAGGPSAPMGTRSLTAVSGSTPQNQPFPDGPLLPFPLPPLPGQEPPRAPQRHPSQGMPPTLMQEAGPAPGPPAGQVFGPQQPQPQPQPQVPPFQTQTQVDAPMPTPPDPDAIMAGAMGAQEARPPERGFMQSLEGGLMSPLTAAGLTLLFPGSGVAGAMNATSQAQQQRQEHERTQSRRSVMDRIWSEAFPNGQPNPQHPLLQGQSPQAMAMIHGLGPETALPLLARSAMERRQLEFKEAGGQAFAYNPSTGQATPIQGTGPAPPAGYRRTGDGQGLEPIPGGPAEQITGEIAGRLALMQTARGHYQQARQYYTNQLSIGEAGRHAIGGALLAPQHNQARRTIRLAIEGALRAATGANAPEPEVDRYTEFFTPHATDPAEVRKQKLDMLEQFMTNAEANATRGRGGPQQGAPASDGFSIRRIQ